MKMKMGDDHCPSLLVDFNAVIKEVTVLSVRRSNSLLGKGGQNRREN